MNLSVADFVPLWIDIGIAALALLVFLWDAVLPARVGRSPIGLLTAAGLVALLLASFFWSARGSAFFGAYVGDEWALFYKRVLLALAAVSALGSSNHVHRVIPRRQGEYFLLLLLSLLGMTLLAGARDLILLVVCFELMGIPLFVLAALEKTDARSGEPSYPAEASMKFFMVGVVSTPLSMFGLSLVIGLAGTSDVAALARADWSPLMALGLLLVLAGMGFKIGVVPFHMWLPDTYQAAATPFVAFLSTAPKIAGFAALCRVFLQGAEHWRQHWLPTVVALCAATLVLGNLWALSQQNVKRLLAYSGIGHIGYLLMAFVANDLFGMSSLLFYLAAYGLTNLGVFLAIEAVTSESKENLVTDFNGLARRSPWLALAMLLFLLSLAGIPFVIGFWAKFYLFIAAWRAGFEWLVVLGALLAVVALFYYLQLARAMYVVPAQSEERLRVKPALALSIVLCLAGVVGLGMYPKPLLEAATGAAVELRSSVSMTRASMSARLDGTAFAP